MSTALGATAALVVGGALAVTATADDATPAPAGLYGEPAPEYELADIPPISQWEVERTGLSIDASGFDRDEQVTIQLGSQSLVVEADFFGDVEVMLTMTATPGEYTLTLSTDESSISHDVTVVADDEFYDARSERPLPFAVPEVLTVSEAADEPVEVRVHDHAGEAAIDVVLDGEYIDTVHTGWPGFVDYPLVGPFSVGEHVVELVHPSISVEVSFTVVRDGVGDAPPAGDYEGVATQTVAGTAWSEAERQYPLTFTIDDEGQIVDVETEYQWVCWLGTPPTGEIGLSGPSATPITAGQPFGIPWNDGLDDHALYGVVHADGAASGSIMIDDGSCGTSRLTWEAQGDVSGQPDPDPQTNIPDDDGSSTARIDDGGIGGTGNQYFLNDSFGPIADTVFTYANRNGRVYVGDWNGDGTDTLAYRIGNTFYVRNSNTAGDAHQVFSYGRAGDRVYVGDWNGDGKDTFAVRRGKTYHVKNTLGGGHADQTIAYGRQNDDVYVGDWNGDGRDTLAVRRGSEYYVKNRIAGGEADQVVNYGRSADDVYVGDWNGNGSDSFAVRRGKTYYIANAIRGGAADRVLNYGRVTDTTLVGDWDGDSTDTLGVRR